MLQSLTFWRDVLVKVNSMFMRVKYYLIKAQDAAYNTTISLKSAQQHWLNHINKQMHN